MKSSRRILLRNAAVAAGLAAAPWLAGPARAQAKASKQAMKYQDKPQGDQRCDNCQQFVPGQSGAQGTCKVVEGPISPSGWCMAYTKKS